MFRIRLKQMRKEKGLTQEELAIKLGLGQSAINNYENTNREPEYSLLVKLADVLECSTDYLLGKSDNKDVNILEGNKLPKQLQGIVEAVGVARNAGLSEKDIKEILELHARMKGKS